MRNNDLIINYGGVLLDVDEQSIGGFDTSTLWDFGKEEAQGKGRSLDLSVPATKNNRKTLNFYDTIPGDGVRRGLEGYIVCGGVTIDGTIFVTGYNGGRYSLMIAYGRNFAGFGGGNFSLSDTMTYNTQDVPATSGAIPNFGWYEYGNFFSPHATTGIIPELLPCTNLGHIITSMAAAAGYTVNYPSVSLGRQYQADAYGLVLPSFGLRGVWHQIDVTGSAMNGYSVSIPGGDTLADAGLELSTAYFKRGQVPQSVKINVLKTLREVNVTLPANSGVVMSGGDGYIIYNDWEGTQGVTFRFRSGAVFAIVNANEWHKAGKNNYWNRMETPHAYEGSVTVSLQSNYGAFEFPQSGDTMYLSEALPQKTLEEWLAIYCNLISGVWTGDEATKEITIKTYSELVTAAFGDAEHHIALENERVIGVESVKRYVDGFAQHNYTRCSDGNGYANIYTRDLRCYNDYLQEEKELAEIPITAGDRMRSSDPEATCLLLDDVRQDDSGAFFYKGELALFFENTVTTDGARHIADTLDMGIGNDLQALVENGSSVSVKLLMPLFRFAKISELTCASLHGRDFVVQRARWDKGVAQLDMLDVGKVLPQMNYDWLNFEMPNGGDITLTRNGSPTAVVLEYSLDNGGTWTEWLEVGNVRTLTLAAGVRVWLRNQSGTSTGLSTSGANYYNFAFSDAVNAYGDTRSLLCSLPFAGVITNFCFYRLFYGCGTLVDAPDLAAATLANYCYYEMFRGCTSLVEAQQLPAATLAYVCYYGMFRDCTSLVSAPQLPAATLANSCYYEMFRGCTSLVSAPDLPASTLANDCYMYMFRGCTSLVSAPQLPAAMLANNCYYGMFWDCTSLVSAPDLPASTLEQGCYMYMFYRCANIDEVTMLATDISATNCLYEWLYNVAASGTLHLDSRLTGIPSDSASGIPTGWNRVDVDPWLNFEMPNGGTITLNKVGSPNEVVLEYSTDAGATWQVWSENAGVRTLTLPAGGRAWIRNQDTHSTTFSTSPNDLYRILFDDDTYAYGDLRSLICKNAADGVITSYCYFRLFQNNSKLHSAPRLDATQIAPYCYAFLFLYCSALAVAPRLPATVIYTDSYRSMFQQCTSLVVAPVLPAATIASGAYRRMFYGCPSLNLVVLHATTASASLCTYQWLNGVAASGDLYCPQSLSFTSTEGGVPAGWTRHDL